MGSWADLHKDVLEVIAERITHHIDLLRFAAVCKTWRYFVKDNLHRLPHNLPLHYCLPRRHPFPLLLQCNDEEADGRVDFFSIRDQEHVSGFSLPEVKKKWIAGSCNGWLFTIETAGREIHLLNPFTRAQICLPSLSTFQHPEGYSIEDEDFGFIEKAVISSDPTKKSSGDDCVVAAIISNMSVLSFCRVGDGRWTNAEEFMVYLSDVIPYNGRFYAISEMGVLVAYEATQDRKVKLIANRVYEPRKRYLVESTSGDLLHVARIKDEETESFTTCFDVYKLEALDESNTATWEFPIRYQTIDGTIVPQRELRSEWVKLESLGDQALFLGRNCSLCLPAQSVPGCKKNCIYFTGDADDDRITRAEAEMYDHVSSRYDMGVYDVAEGIIEPFEEMNGKFFANPSVWVTPNPW